MNKDLISKEQAVKAISEIMADVLISGFAGRQISFDDLNKRLREHIQNLPATQDREMSRRKNEKAYSFDNKYYSCTYNTDEEALDKALIEIDNIRRYDPEQIPDTVYIGDCEFFKPSLAGSSWDIISAVAYQAYDEGFGEWADDYLTDVTKEQGEELEEELEKVFQHWIDKYNYHATFFMVNSYDIYFYDKEEHKLILDEKGDKGLL